MLLDPFVKKFGYQKKTDYKKYAIFIQNSNDLDTCCSALILCKVLKKLQNANCVIYGLQALKISPHYFLPEIKRYAYNENNQLEIDEDTMAIMVDVNAHHQITEPNWKLIEKCGEVLRIDHHEKSEGFKINMLKIIDTTSSCSELVWQIVKEHIKNQSSEFLKDIAETCFYGMYGDTKGITTSNVDHRTFTTLSEIAMITNEIPNLIRKMNEKSLEQLKIFSDLINELVIKNKLVIANLKPEIMYRYYPHNFILDERKIIRQRKIFTQPLNFLEKYLKFNCLVYIHYCLRKPFNNNDKFVFVVIKKENPKLEELLIKNGFTKQWNRFSRKSIDLMDLTKLIEDNEELFKS